MPIIGYHSIFPVSNAELEQQIKAVDDKLLEAVDTMTEFGWEPETTIEHVLGFVLSLIADKDPRDANEPIMFQRANEILHRMGGYAWQRRGGNDA